MKKGLSKGEKTDTTASTLHDAPGPGKEIYAKQSRVGIETAGGVVSFYLQGSPGVTMGEGPTPFQLNDLVQAGLLVSELDALQASLDVPMDQLAPKLGISKATLHRRKVRGRLGREESDRVVRYARLMGKAVEVMESEENARRWLLSPQVGLGGAVPLNFAETEVGAREVEDLLGRIEYGVYS